MVRPIVQHVAALTERAQILRPIVGRVAIQVRRCEHDERHPKRERDEVRTVRARRFATSHHDPLDLILREALLRPVIELCRARVLACDPP
jgi:hypothetical protein